MRYFSAFMVLVLLTGIFSCSVKLPELTFTGEKTALENQVLGTYQQIESDSWLIASTRSFNSNTAELSAPKQEVLEAVQNRKFNKDDVDELKRDKAIGEDNKGYLAVLDNDSYKQKPDYKQFVDQIVLEENRDRQIIFERVMAVNMTAAQAGQTKVTDIFAKLNYDASEPGTLIQTPDGKWIEKPKPGK
jgi:uncharacterized protein YdbL (DUF1318 family)